MKRKFDPLIKYEQKDKIQWLHIVTFGHLLLALFLLLPNPDGCASNYNAQVCLFITFFFLPIIYFYKWKNPILNSFLPFAYILLIIAEFSMAGIPGDEHMLYFNAHRLEGPTETSFFIDHLLATIPIIYFAIRICLVPPITSVIRRKNMYYSIRQ